MLYIIYISNDMYRHIHLNIHLNIYIYIYIFIYIYILYILYIIYNVYYVLYILFVLYLYYICSTTTIQCNFVNLLEGEMMVFHLEFTYNVG